ncbi:response regulator [Paenibacillus sp. CC-CFT747]|nr:response regulator [Paenibacillus sp. CC-CFT747]
MKDTGIGIPDDKLEQLFKPFSQLDSSTTRKYGGTGLGLAICKTLVELMGGGIRVDRTAEAGATFVFTIKAGRCPEELEELLARQKANAAPPDKGNDAGRTSKERRPLHILVCEDNATNQKLLTRILESLGHEAEVAPDGKSAVELALKKSFDLVLMDIQMPEMDGKEAARQIIAKLPASRRPVIIAMTANVLKEEKDKCLSIGMDDFIGKPIKIDQFRQKLEQEYEKLTAGRTKEA